MATGSIEGETAAVPGDGGHVLVSATGPAAERAVCRRLRGTAETRTVTVAATATAHAVRERHGGDADRFGVVDVAGVSTRSGTASATGGGQTPANAAWYAAASGPAELATIGGAVCDHVDRLAAAAGTPDPGELRLCVDSLTPFFEAVGDRAILRFCHVLAATMRAVDGSTHVHVGPVDDRRRRLVEPVFDATVTARDTDDGVQARVTYHDGRDPTPWRPL